MGQEAQVEAGQMRARAGGVGYNRVKRVSARRMVESFIGSPRAPAYQVRRGFDDLSSSTIHETNTLHGRQGNISVFVGADLVFTLAVMIVG